MSATTEDGRACWLAAVTESDHPRWMAAEDVAAHRAAAEREAQRVGRERLAAEEAREEEIRARLHRQRVIEAVTGAASSPSVGEVLAREDARSDRAMLAQERAAGIASGEITDLDAPVPGRRPAELAKVADARGAREARELGADLAAAGQPVAGAAYAQLGKRP